MEVTSQALEVVVGKKKVLVKLVDKAENGLLGMIVIQFIDGINLLKLVMVEKQVQVEILHIQIL